MIGEQQSAVEKQFKIFKLNYFCIYLLPTKSYEREIFKWLLFVIEYVIFKYTLKVHIQNQKKI